jgi:hypothetical protein
LRSQGVAECGMPKVKNARDRLKERALSQRTTAPLER